MASVPPDIGWKGGKVADFDFVCHTTSQLEVCRQYPAVVFLIQCLGWTVGVFLFVCGLHQVTNNPPTAPNFHVGQLGHAA